MPATKKGKSSSKSDESVSSNAKEGQDGNQLTGSIVNDFPIICSQNGLAPISIRNMDEPDVQPPPPAAATSNPQYWVWCKFDSSEEPSPSNKKLAKFAIRNLKVTTPLMTALQTTFQTVTTSEISLWQTDIDLPSLSSLSELIPQVQCRMLDIGGSSLNDLTPIKKLLLHQEYKNLTGLSLRCCALQDDHLLPLCEALAEDSPLQQLDLGQNSLTDDGIKMIAESLRMNRNLISLSLSGNSITDIGVSYISLILKEFVLNHKEIVRRRKLFSATTYSDQWMGLSESLSRRTSSRKSLSREKQQTVDSGKKSGGPTTGALVKAASFIAKTKKGAENKKKASKGGSSMDDKTAPSTPTHQTSSAPVAQGPLIDGVETNAKGDVVCQGNYSIINLSLSYNKIGKGGVDLLLSVIQYQTDHVSVHGIGLQSISLQGNLFPISYSGYSELMETLTSKSSLLSSSRSTSEDLRPQ